MADETTTEQEQQDAVYQQYVEQLKLLQEKQTQALNNMAAAQSQASDIARQQLDISKRSAEIAEERYNYWKENFEPLEQEVIAKGLTGINEDEAARYAGSEMQAAYGAAGGVNDRFLQRLGINPNDPRYASMRDDLDIARTAAVTGAKNSARQRARDTTQQMRLAVAGMGRGIPVQSMSVLGQSANTVGNAGNIQMRGAAGVIDSSMLGARLGLQNTMAANNAQAANTQFLAERAFQTDVNDIQRTANMWSTLGNVVGTGVGAASSFSGMGGGSPSGSAGPAGIGAGVGGNAMGAGATGIRWV